MGVQKVVASDVDAGMYDDCSRGPWKLSAVHIGLNIMGLIVNMPYKRKQSRQPKDV
jgi:hypothetical protein